MSNTKQPEIKLPMQIHTGKLLNKEYVCYWLLQTEY